MTSLTETFATNSRHRLALYEERLRILPERIEEAKRRVQFWNESQNPELGKHAKSMLNSYLRELESLTARIQREKERSIYYDGRAMQQEADRRDGVKNYFVY